jgi:hypothetical protein
LSNAIATKDISGKQSAGFVDTAGSIETHAEQSLVSWLDKTLSKEQINLVGREDFCLPETVDFHRL